MSFVSYRMLPLAAGLICGLLTAALQTSDLRAEETLVSRLPGVLSPADIKRYRDVFRIQEAGRWKEADQIIKNIDNRILMGHVLHQRYMHPRKWRSTYKQLKGWMAAYADHPDAGRVHKLALRRRPKNYRMPTRPESLPARPAYLNELIEEERLSTRSAKPLPQKKLSKSDRRRASNYKRQIKRALRRGHTLVAKRMISSKGVRSLFSRAEWDQTKAWLGTRYFFHGRVGWAKQWASEAIEKSSDFVPEAHWTLGLVYWGAGEHAKASEHFQAAADIGFADEWLDGAANFWAARSLMVARQPGMVTHYLRRSSAHARTFYGLLAARILGQRLEYRWSSPPLVETAVKKLATMPRGKRAIALIQVGQARRAERELRNLARLSDKAQAESILALADAGGMAGLAVRLSDRLFPDGGGYDGAAYPIPTWKPKEGFTMDRALVYALIRQESRFNPKAKSWAGARGLMQIMPGTGRFVAQNHGIRGHKSAKLYDPEYNLGLGQRYLDMLLKEKHISGDLMLVVAAWNGGPGNLNKWLKRTPYGGDPLYFIETIPARETRAFVEHVFANLWIYRDRLGQEKPTLDALAQGQRPVYKALGNGSVEIARFHDGN